MSEVQSISHERYQEIIANNDVDAMESLLNGELIYDEENAPSHEPVAETENKPDVESAASSAEVNAENWNAEEDEENVADGKEPLILSKDGKHFIEYSKLSSARQKARDNELRAIEAEARAKALEAKVAELSSGNQSLKQSDLDSLTDEEIAELSETDPILGKAIKVLMQKTEAVNAQVKAQSVVQKPVHAEKQNDSVIDESPASVQAAIDAIPILAEWQEADPDTFRLAGDIDSKLSQDPSYKKLPLHERYQIVAERTQAALGKKAPAKQKFLENPEQIAQQKIAAAKQVRPNSLTNMGVSPSSEKSFAESFAEMSPSQQQFAMAKMSDEEIARLLGG